MIQQKSEINSKDFGNSEILYKLREMADEANQPLMKYLADNLRTLSHWLNEVNEKLKLCAQLQVLISCSTENKDYAEIFCSKKFYWTLRLTLDARHHQKQKPSVGNQP